MARTRSSIKPNSRKATALVESAVNAIIQAQLSESKASIDIMKIGELFKLAMLAYTRGAINNGDDAHTRTERTKREIREWIRVNCDATHPDELPVLTTPPAFVSLAPELISEVPCGACGGNADERTGEPDACVECSGLGRLTNPALVAAREAGTPVWSGATLPTIGERVHVRINSIGASTVLGYFVEHGFLGLYVKPEKAPEWYLKQNGNTPAHVFGIEIEPVAS